MHDCCEMNYAAETFRPCIIYQKVPPRPAGGVLGTILRCTPPKTSQERSSARGKLPVVVLLPVRPAATYVARVFPRVECNPEQLERMIMSCQKVGLKLSGAPA